MAVNYIGGGNLCTGKKHWPAASHWQSLSHNVVSKLWYIKQVLHNIKVRWKGNKVKIQLFIKMIESAAFIGYFSVPYNYLYL
jgi:hypothetical protein